MEILRAWLASSPGPSSRDVSEEIFLAMRWGLKEELKKEEEVIRFHARKPKRLLGANKGLFLKVSPDHFTPNLYISKNYQYLSLVIQPI